MKNEFGYFIGKLLLFSYRFDIIYSANAYIYIIYKLEGRIAYDKQPKKKRDYRVFK